MGAAFNETKHERAETNKRISQVFPFWFCPAFNKAVQNDEPVPFDQHFLLAASAPRYVLVASAEDDLWADPACEFESCVHSSPAFELYGCTGFVNDGDLDARINKIYGDGHIGYHRRKGSHFLSREDWNFYMNFIKSKM